ncbi:GPALPP motifs-containing protein 1-like isoform X3 [Phlebotomus papatasi]|uniref:GPALPP motifs-containing protein 1-like isoform X3 n=1 Tax=Phlebotomus papatasi TaxID=29031 RepID=UPI002484004E|nr:GPALPP motifs-containing protein 1-like isoform X3 [Phlebotomus papatasi]XP_055699244.1 GPALPP motifs-containing protein 1-like isoform X3 [Phlebotomus papatasi]XP_055699245.1 GPALPP motifs-containing protein 1-like isoform X3 [Phlebotomus papatasi]
MDDDDMTFGPALPPHLLQSSSNNTSGGSKIIGPCMPTNFKPALVDVESSENSSDDEEKDIADVGPLPPGQEPKSQAQLELEERALEIRLSGMEGSKESSKQNFKTREEWMTELPEVRKVGDLGLRPRQFRQTEGPDFSHRSSWTDTPQSRLEKEKSKGKNDASDRTTFEQKLLKERDKAMEKLKKKYDKEHKRDKSLLEIHQDKLKKKKKKDKKKERRPFSREVDLAVNKFDETRKNAAIKKSQLLDTRFSAGSSKFL